MHTLSFARSLIMQVSRWHRRFQKLGLIGLLLLAINFTYQIYYRYIAKPSDTLHRQPCDLRYKACTVTLSNDRQIEFEIMPRHLVLDEKLTFSVHLKNITPSGVSLTLTPIGQVQYAQDFTMKDSGKGHYSVKAKLNDVALNQADWLALVRLQDKDQYISFPFKFSVS